MTRLALLLAITLLVPACAPVRATSATTPNPLVGSWTLERYVDTPEGGAPIYAFGEHPSGLFVFTADGHVSINLMRNPPAIGQTVDDPDPDACIPGWYCSYYGTYDYDSSGPSWTTHVVGGNIPNYLQTDQTRHFRFSGDTIVISERYEALGKLVIGERILRRVRR